LVGYRLNKENKPIKIQNPVTVIKEKVTEHKEQKDIQKEQDYWQDVFNNLENYDGTPESQKKVRNVNEV
jgi:hypothetical protein